MDKIIDIRAYRRARADNEAPRGPAAVVIFPGVRYERDCAPPQDARARREPAARAERRAEPSA